MKTKRPLFNGMVSTVEIVAGWKKAQSVCSKELCTPYLHSLWIHPRNIQLLNWAAGSQGSILTHNCNCELLFLWTKSLAKFQLLITFGICFCCFWNIKQIMEWQIFIAFTGVSFLLHCKRSSTYEFKDLEKSWWLFVCFCGGGDSNDIITHFLFSQCSRFLA